MKHSNPTAETPKWRLEAFDARAGLAFAVWRCARPQGGHMKVDDWPCLFFAAPGFAPEPVHNVALAMSAARGSFDPGLYLDRQEASFDSPEEVAEFVRRAYVGSAGGDGGDSAGGDGEPFPPGDQPPDLPPIDGGPDLSESSVTARVLHLAKQFESHSQELTFGKTTVFSWAGLSTNDGIGALATGALRIMRELLARSQPKAGAERTLQWQGDLRALGGAIARMGLWPELCSTLRNQMNQLMSGARPINRVWEELDTVERVCLLFGASPALDDEDAIYIFFRYRHHFEWPFALTRSTEAVDPMDFLRRMPLPRFAVRAVAEDLKDRASMYHLVSTFVASPQTLSQPSFSRQEQEALVEMVLFACACIVRCHTPSADQCSSYEWIAHPRPPSPMQRAQVHSTVEDATAWLSEHLPGRAFAPLFEALIGTAKNIRYR